jgi:hypothetical protein
MRFFSSTLIFLLSIAATISSPVKEKCIADVTGQANPANNCINFSVTSGTGCAWMCSYCANNLGTNNYYFTNGVCTYQAGQGCVGNPQAGVTYTCCSA